MASRLGTSLLVVCVAVLVVLGAQPVRARVDHVRRLDHRPLSYAYDVATNTVPARVDGGADPAAAHESEPSPIALVVAAEEATAGARSVGQVLDDLPQGRQAFVRIVPDEATLQATFEELTQGGAPTTWKGFAGDVFELPDGTQIGMRGASSSGGATIDIRIPGHDPFKIHIG